MKQELIKILKKHYEFGAEKDADQILDLILDKIEDCKPLYLEGESKDFTEGQEWTIRQIKNKLRE